MHLIGVDVGSTNWKVIAYDHAGRVAARCRCPAKTHFEGEGAYYLPDEMWETLAGGIRQVVAELPDPVSVDGIAVTSVGEAGVLLDSAGRAVCPSLAWFDPRTAPQAERWRAQFDDDYELYELTGFAPQHIASVNKLLWVREHDPDAYARARVWLCMADFVAQRLSGEKAMDYSLASRTGLFDIEKREWSERLLEAAGINRSLMPPLAPSGSPVGLVGETASKSTGLPVGTPVFTGGHDHICGALAVGVTEEGEVLDSTGTAEAVLMVLRGPNTSRALCESGFSVGCHTARDRYYLIGSLSTSGAVVEWLKDRLEAGSGAGAGASSGQAFKDAYAALMELANSIPPGAEGLFFLPYLRGSTTVHVDSLARGAFVGLSYNHGRAHLVRSALEGVCYELGAMLDMMRELTGVSCRELTAIGGATRNDLWMRMKADVTGRTVSVPAIEEATTFGAALLAGLGAGVYRDEVDMRRTVQALRTRIDPDEGRSRVYQAYRRVYARLYPACKEVFHAIAAETRSSEPVPPEPAATVDSPAR